MSIELSVSSSNKWMQIRLKIGSVFVVLNTLFILTGLQHLCFNCCYCITANVFCSNFQTNLFVMTGPNLIFKRSVGYISSLALFVYLSLKLFHPTAPTSHPYLQWLFNQFCACGWVCKLFYIIRISQDLL